MWALLPYIQEIILITTANLTTSRKQSGLSFAKLEKCPHLLQTIFTMQDSGTGRKHSCHVSTNLPGISDGTEWKAFCLVKQ